MTLPLTPEASDYPPSETFIQFDNVDETIEAFRNGEFVVVLDSPDRENEGDLIIAASALTPAKMAFMIHHSSGLICAPLSASLCDDLKLPQMVPLPENTESLTTAYTVSIDSEDPSVTTGISAHDRAVTCNSLASPDVKAEHFRRPGHVFPLRAKDGGVRVRRGHTEAAIDLCRLAGLAPASAICEIVDEGEQVEGVTERKFGGMLRAEGCLKFARKWGIKICTIEDMVEYIEKKEGKWVS